MKRLGYRAQFREVGDGRLEGVKFPPVLLEGCLRGLAAEDLFVPIKKLKRGLVVRGRGLVSNSQRNSAKDPQVEPYIPQ